MPLVRNIHDFIRTKINNYQHKILEVPSYKRYSTPLYDYSEKRSFMARRHIYKDVRTAVAHTEKDVSAVDAVINALWFCTRTNCNSTAASRWSVYCFTLQDHFRQKDIMAKTVRWSMTTMSATTTAVCKTLTKSVY